MYDDIEVGEERSSRRAGLTFKEIGEILDISHQRVEQIFRKAMKKLRGQMSQQQRTLEDFM